MYPVGRALVISVLLALGCTASEPPKVAVRAPVRIEPTAQTRLPSPRLSSPRAAARHRPPVAPQGNVWYRLAFCESGLRQNAHSANGLYHSFFQWHLGTWRSVGGSGDPHNAPWDEQLKRAKMLHARAGFAPWPACSRKLGL